MISVKTALIQMPVCEEVDINLKMARSFVLTAAENGANIAALPEMFCCPYASSSFIKNKEKKGGRIWQALCDMAADAGIWLIGGSMPEEDGGSIYNSCFVFSPEGKQAARHRKVHLFDIDVKGGVCFKESDTFTPGNEVTVFDTPFGRMGVEICFDIRFSEFTRLMALDGAQMIFVPAAFNMTTGPAHWELHFRARALDNQLYMLGCSPARDVSAPYVSYGNTIITSPWGDVIGKLDEKEGILYAEINTEHVKEIREQLPILKARRTDLYTLEKIRL